ncbi:MAG: hypothetical protein ABII12_08530 [Planctomycetota bacterium]
MNRASRCRYLVTSIVLLWFPSAAMATPEDDFEQLTKEIPSLLQLGEKLSAEKVNNLKRELKSSPKQRKARLLLIGYYGAKGEEARKSLQRQVLAFIKYHPHSVAFAAHRLQLPNMIGFDADLFGTMRLDPKRDGKAYVKASKLWWRLTSENDADAEILGNAGVFLLSSNRDEAAKLLLQAHQLDPLHPRLISNLLVLFEADSSVGLSLDGDRQKRHYKHVLTYLRHSYELAEEAIVKSGKPWPPRIVERAGKPDAAGLMRLFVCIQMLHERLMIAALEADDPTAAEAHALRLLEVNRSTGAWNRNYGNVVHNANEVLGRLDLRDGRVQDAKKHLLIAGRAPASPELHHYGPSLFLARELLQQGERTAVLKYLDLVNELWKPYPYIRQKERRVATWREDIKSGNTPWPTLQSCSPRAFQPAPEKCPACARNLRSIGTALWIYAMDDNHFPPDLATAVRQHKKIDVKGFNKDTLRCPHSKTESSSSEICYIYIAGQTPDDDERNVLVYTKNGLHGADGGYVLYQDGEVDFIASYDEIEKLVRATEKRLYSRN